MREKLRRGFAGFAAAACMAGLAVTPVAASSGASGGTAKIEAGLLDNLARGDADRFVVELSAAADLDAAVARGTERGQATYDALVQTAQTSQRGVLADAQRAGAPARSFWVANEVVVYSADRALVQQLAARAEVRRIRATRTANIEAPTDRKAVDDAVAVAMQTAVSGNPTWGVDRVGADDLWTEGIAGAGIVVASMDTGVDYTHPAIVNQYRGNLGGGVFDHSYNWFDATAVCPDAPCDDFYHGTHTVGTMVGGDGPGPFTPDIGVAPGAQWIGTKPCVVSFCTEEALLAAGEWLVAPTDLEGLNPDPSKRPDVVNNSWSGPGGDPWFQPMVDAWIAAGIVPVFSAGNTGPECGTARSPGDYTNALAVGLTDINDQIGAGSARGPSLFGGIHPDVVAPGLDVASAIPGGGYDSVSGTSMATPHAAGSIALILSANAALRGDIGAVYDALTAGAVDHPDGQCGGDVDLDPNNVYGEGRVDAQASAEMVAAGGRLEGAVTDAARGTAIPGARVVFAREGRSFPVTTDAAGHYLILLAAGTYAATVTAFGYGEPDLADVTVITGATATVDAALTPLRHRHLSGHVVQAGSSTPIARAGVRVLGTPVTAVTGGDGGYDVSLPVGAYTVEATMSGCALPATAQVVVATDVSGFDLAITSKLDRFGYSCRPIPAEWVTARHETAMTGDGVIGRFPLPFAFPFYGETYSTVWATDEGYLTFLEPTFVDGSPITPPYPSEPNAAIYALWQTMSLIASSTVAYDVRGQSPNRVFVIEYRQLLGPGGKRIDFEVKLHEDGAIDVLYGANPESPGTGAHAVVGIENAAGDDALLFSAQDAVIDEGAAFRYEIVPTGVVSGDVRDANTDLALPGADISAEPGGLHAVAHADGSYSLRLHPGTYELHFTRSGYTSAIHPVTVAAGDTVDDDADLTAPMAEVDTTAIDARVGFGGSTTATVTLSNPGSAPLDFVAREADDGATHPTFPPALRPTTVGDDLPVVIEDPAGDAIGPADITVVRGHSSPVELAVAIEFVPGAPIFTINGWVMLDTDQNPDTGVDPAFFGPPSGQDIGIDFAANLAMFQPGAPVYVVDTAFNIVYQTPAVVDGTTVFFAVPLDALGHDDGQMDVDVLASTGPIDDLAPDPGHGTIDRDADAPWFGVDPATGTVAPGESATLTVSLGGASIEPGAYAGRLVLSTNAPVGGTVVLDVDLRVRLPLGFGEIAGALTDAHTGRRVTGSLTVHAQWQGSPLDVPVNIPRGSYDVLVPAGTWPVDVVADGYVSQSASLVVASGFETAFDVQLHAVQPHATLEGGPVAVTLAPGESSTVSVMLGNVEGHAPLDFTASSSAPWVTPSPLSGTVAEGETTSIGVTIDATGVAPGVYAEEVDLATNDPDNPVVVVPVQMLVTAYRQRVNVGGAAYDDHGVGVWAADRAYATGSFGYVGGTPKSTSLGIKGTSDDPLYQDQQEGLSSYRFDVPNGHYEIELHFAELDDVAAFGRIFDVVVEGATVVTNLDLAAAAHVRTAYVVVAEADVSDGRLDVALRPKLGAPPVLNAVSVLWASP